MNDVIAKLFAHNDQSNRRYIEALRARNPIPDRASSIFSHVLNAHRIWNARIAGETPTGSWDVQPAETWEDLNRFNHDRTRQVLAADSLDRLVDDHDLKGTPRRNTVRDILLQVITHSSYHRGQLAMLIGSAGATPPVTDYIAFARELENVG